MSEKWFVIVNPNAGKQRGKHDWKRISALLHAGGIDYMSYFTESRGHAIDLTRKYIRSGFRKFIVVGGDGTLNEVVNGIFTQRYTDPSTIVLGMIPVGTGNDWCRMFGIPGDYKMAIDIIIRQNIFVQDVGLIKYYIQDGGPVLRYYATIAGMGFDAMVLEKANRDKERGKGNSLSYFVHIFTSLFSFKSTRATITLDDRTITSEVFSMLVAICQYTGGGMKMAPYAVANDGLFDLNVIRPIGKFKVIRNILKLLDGSYTKLPEVITFKTRNVEIVSQPELNVEADGESLGHSPFTFSIIPQGLRIIYGEVSEIG